ncbi:hypothetical protein L1987_45900 [Smallanthus sonchifolius]|uniref:Uncharacterized protein n=1 Tax=Smallanthus sonchifolius TaxID=185202 RepID=A0ACB9FYV2_9ASTR|nr:hypothetical protein L1987_45900 [Smallanthus sonchifolius]
MSVFRLHLLGSLILVKAAALKVSESLRLNSTNWRGGFSECAKGTLFLALTIREQSSRKSIRNVQRNYEVFQRLYRCLDKARIPRRSQLNEEQDLSEPERLHPMSLSSLKPKGSKGLDKAKLAMQSTLDAPKTSVPTLSALQLVKGVKKGEETFVAALVGDEENGSSEELPTVL